EPRPAPARRHLAVSHEQQDRILGRARFFEHESAKTVAVAAAQVLQQFNHDERFRYLDRLRGQAHGPFDLRLIADRDFHGRTSAAGRTGAAAPFARESTGTSSTAPAFRTSSRSASLSASD